MRGGEQTGKCLCRALRELFIGDCCQYESPSVRQSAFKFGAELVDCSRRRYRERERGRQPCASEAGEKDVDPAGRHLVFVPWMREYLALMFASDRVLFVVCDRVAGAQWMESMAKLIDCRNLSPIMLVTHICGLELRFYHGARERKGGGRDGRKV